MLVLFTLHHELDIDSLVDSLIVLAICPYIWNCLDEHWHVLP
jgi:hypothetical protein